MTTSFSPLLQRAHLADIAPDVHGRIRRGHECEGTAELDGLSVTEVTFGVGARWSADLNHDAGTDSCLPPHVALVVAGTLHVELDGNDHDD